MKMAPKTILPVLCLLIAATTASAKEANLISLYASSGQYDPPFSLFEEGGSWTPAKGARFARLDMYFKEPVKVTKIEVVACSTTGVVSDITAFINYVDTPPSADKEAPGDAESAVLSRHGDRWAINRFEGLDGRDRVLTVRSLTLNFEANRGFSVCGLRILDEGRMEYAFKVPRMVMGGVKASSTRYPGQLNGAANLFDSRLDYGWASDKEAPGAKLSFAFKERVRIEKFMIWNGRPRSPSECLASGVVKTMTVDGDGGYSAQIALEHRPGFQVVTLPKPFEGMALDMTVTGVYDAGGALYAAVNELRFYDGGRWFMLSPAAGIKDAREENRARFNEAELPYVLDDGFVMDGSRQTALRLRSDGSFYLSGVKGTQLDRRRRFFAAGSYEIKGVDINDGINLRLIGLYRETEEYGDCAGCALECAKAEGNARGSRIQERVWLRPGPGTTFYIKSEKGSIVLRYADSLYERE